ncbi:hypothetical protein ACPA1U_02920, partial [Ectopseudomonas hydrolytica]
AAAPGCGTSTRTSSWSASPSPVACRAASSAAAHATTEQQILQLQETWAEIIGDAQLAWNVLAQCLGSLLLARMMASQESRQQVLAASLDMLEHTLKPVG